MSIRFVTVQARPCAYVRCELPARAMLRKHKITSFLSQTVDMDERTNLPIVHTNFPVWVFQMPTMLDVKALILSLKAVGKAVVCEYDDDYFNYPSSNEQVIQDLASPYLVKVRKEIASLAHMITVSTPELVPIYQEFNKNVVVLPNCIDFADFPKRKKEGKRIVIGWAGAQQCGNEALIIPVLEQLVEDNLKVDIAIGGDKRVFDSLSVPDNRKRYLPYCDITEFPKMINNFDIAVIPLLDNKFNAGKSNLRGLYYAALKIPFLASDVAPYRRFAKMAGTDEFLVKNQADWLPKLQALIDNKNMRQFLGDVSYKVAESSQIDDHIEKWIDAYYEATEISRAS